MLLSVGRNFNGKWNVEKIMTLEINMDIEIDYLRNRLCEILNDIQDLEIKVNNLMIFTEEYEEYPFVKDETKQ